MALEDEIAVKHSLVRHGEVSDEPVESVARRRENLNDMRKRCGMLPATFHYQDPTPEMLTDPLWNAIWDEIKPWDIHVPSEYSGYCGATGNHVTAIFLAIEAQLERRFESLVASMGGRVVAAE
jgi:hypothetical protein